jgi:hypothetical protein
VPQNDGNHPLRSSASSSEEGNDVGLRPGDSSLPERRQVREESRSEMSDDEFVLQATNIFGNDAGVQEIDDIIDNTLDWDRWCFVSTYIQNMDRKIRRALGRSSDRVFPEY